MFGMRLAVVERAGDAIAKDAKSEPLRKQGCRREDCFACKTEEGGDCEMNGVGYRISCITCVEDDNLTAEYEGETGRNGYSRGKEHLSGLKNEVGGNPLWKHCSIQHESTEAKFVMKIVGQHKSLCSHV